MFPAIFVAGFLFSLDVTFTFVLLNTYQKWTTVSGPAPEALCGNFLPLRESLLLGKLTSFTQATKGLPQGDRPLPSCHLPGILWLSIHLEAGLHLSPFFPSLGIPPCDG